MTLAGERRVSPAARPAAAYPSAPRWWSALIGLALFGLALAPRWIGLEQHLTADDSTWVGRVSRFEKALQQGRWRETYQSGHPGVTVLWLAALAMGPERAAELAPRSGNSPGSLEKSPSFLGSIYDARRVLAVVSAALVVLLADLAWRLFGPWVGLLAGLLLASEPFLVAHGRLLHADALEAQLVAASLLAALVFFDRRGGRAYLVGSGLAAGLAFLTKAPSVLLFAAVPLIGLAWTWRRPRPESPAPPWRALAIQLGLWGLAAGAIYALLWPAVWVDPLGTVERLVADLADEGESARTWGSFFLGQPVRDVGPLFYPVVTLLRLSPITLAGLAALAWLALRAGRRPGGAGLRQGHWPVVGALVVYAVVFTAIMGSSPKQADRYVMPVYPILAILAGLGLALVLHRLPRPSTRLAASLALGLGQAALVAGVQPYPLSFYDPLLGGAPVASRLVEIGWGEGLDQVAAFLNSQPNPEQIVTASLNEGLMHAQLRGTALPIWEWPKADYLVDYINMDQRGIIPVPLQAVVRGEAPLFTARVNGLDYARVYRIPTEAKAEGERAGPPRKSSVPRP